jgi:hypothetical protein
MKEYYLMAIQLNNSSAMINLGNYYYKIEEDYDKINEYYLMALQLNNSSAKNQFKKYTTPLERYIYYKEHSVPFDEELT